MNKLTFPVLIEKDEDGYFATGPSLQGCYTQGDTYEEVLVNIQDAISLHLQDRRAAVTTSSIFQFCRGGGANMSSRLPRVTAVWVIRMLAGYDFERIYL